jgi:hypothetical protein
MCSLGCSDSSLKRSPILGIASGLGSSPFFHCSLSFDLGPSSRLFWSFLQVFVGFFEPLWQGQLWRLSGFRSMRYRLRGKLHVRR